MKTVNMVLTEFPKHHSCSNTLGSSLILVRVHVTSLEDVRINILADVCIH